MVETNKASGAKGGGSISAKRKCSLDDYDMTTTLGTGSFGRVLLAKQKKTGDYFAMKRLTKNDIVKLR